MTTDPITLDPDALTAAAKALGKHRGTYVGELVLRPIAEDAVTAYLRALPAERPGREDFEG